MGAVIRPPGEAMEELDSPYHRCAGRAGRTRQGAVVALKYRQVRRSWLEQGGPHESDPTPPPAVQSHGGPPSEFAPHARTKHETEIIVDIIMFFFLGRDEVSAPTLLPTPSVNNVEAVSFDVKLTTAEHIIQEKKTKNALHEDGTADRGDDENASRRDDKSVPSTLANASIKSARSKKSLLLSKSARFNKSAQSCALNKFDQKSKDVVVGKSKKKRGVVGLTLVVGVAVGVFVGLYYKNRGTVRVEANAEAAYLADYDGPWYYDKECLSLHERARNLKGDVKTSSVTVLINKKRDEEVEESIGSVRHREYIIITSGPKPEGVPELEAEPVHPEHYRKCTERDSVYGTGIESSGGAEFAVGPEKKAEVQKKAEGVKGGNATTPKSKAAKKSKATTSKSKASKVPSTTTAIEEYILQECTNNPNCEACADYGGAIGDWDVSEVQDFGFLFYDDNNEDFFAAFNEPIHWNTGSATNMISMFDGARAFNQPLSFDTAEVTDVRMGVMFAGATAFNQPVAFDTAKVTNVR
ncbi:hypothetical protein THAOC_24146, partial [Thalassiosira oceanica]